MLTVGRIDLRQIKLVKIPTGMGKKLPQHHRFLEVLLAGDNSWERGRHSPLRCGYWQAPHGPVDSSIPVHISSALTDFSELSKKSEDRKLGVGVVDGCGGRGIAGRNSKYDYIYIYIYI